MSDLCFFAASLLTQSNNLENNVPVPSPSINTLTNRCLAAGAKQVNPAAIAPPMSVATPEASQASVNTITVRKQLTPDKYPTTAIARPSQPSLLLPPLDPGAAIPQSTPLQAPRPMSGPELYLQRQMALQTGKTYTRLPANSFWEHWTNATAQPTYQQWVNLLTQEANAMAKGQGNNRLTVMLGDSLYLWYPPEQLSSDRFWLNQGISGDTTTGILRRLSVFNQTRPDVIHIMAGINDLRRGATDAEILANLQQIMRQLRQSHPHAQIVIHSLLPTRLPSIVPERIVQINQNLEIIAQQENVTYLNLFNYFVDNTGSLRRDLTTDGLHLNPRGYAMWRWAMRSHNLA
jgi:lysophospholipase L1-like esterase